MEENIAENTGTAPEKINNEPSQTPLEQEIAREQKRTEGRTEAEKAAFSLKKNAERLAELGGDPAEVLGIKKDIPSSTDKDTPLTVGMYEQMQRTQGLKTALELADSISDENERELTKKYLQRIVPSGDAQEDLRFARLAVNSVKNGKIVEEMGRGTRPATYASGAGAPPHQRPQEPELSAGEMAFMKAPFNMTPEKIIALRPKEE